MPQAQVPASTPLIRWLTPLTALASHPSFDPATCTREAALHGIVEANVRAQVANIVNTSVMSGAWEAWRAQQKDGQRQEGVDEKKKVYVHGWVYNLESGRLRDLGVSEGPEGRVGGLFVGDGEAK